MERAPVLQVMDRPEQIIRLCNDIKQQDIIAYDCETTGLTTRHEIIGISLCFDEYIAYYIILAKWNVDKLEYLHENIKYTKELIQILATKRLIMHNSVFDCQMAESYFKVNLMPAVHTDTMILAHLLDENRRVGLKELGKELFGEDSADEQDEVKASALANGAKLTKETYELYKADSMLMGKYGAKDALLTYKLFLALVPELYDQGLDKFFYEEESMPLLRNVTYELNTAGLQVDTDRLIILKKTLEAECLAAKDFISSEIAAHIKDKYPGTNKKNIFNIGSSSQLAWLLFGKMELEFSKLTKEGKVVCKALGLRLPYFATAKRDFISTVIASKDRVYQPKATVNGRIRRAKKVKDPWSYIMADKGTLAKFSDKLKWVAALLEYQRKQKLLNTYIEGIETKTSYGIIQPQFLQHGTTSGRYSSRNPNFQNLPRDEKRIKECIIARPGKIFVGADYSQLEPRVFAYTSQDKRLMDAFNGDDDFYSVIGMDVYSKFDCTPSKDDTPEAFKTKYKKLRNDIKVFALASVYGATAHQLAPTTGKSIEDTQEDIDTYFEQFPGVPTMMKDSHEQAKDNGYVTNLFGRPRRMPEAKRIKKLYGNVEHAELPYEARNVLNLAVNHRIQSTAASIVNRASIAFKDFCNKAGVDCKIVLQVHDSLVIECNEADADAVSDLLQCAMEETTLLPGVPLAALPKKGRNLAEV